MMPLVFGTHEAASERQGRVPSLRLTPAADALRDLRTFTLITTMPTNPAEPSVFGPDAQLPDSRSDKNKNKVPVTVLNQNLNLNQINAPVRDIHNHNVINNFYGDATNMLVCVSNALWCRYHMF